MEIAVPSEVVKEMMSFNGLSSLSHGVKGDFDLSFVNLFSTFLNFDSLCGQNFARRQIISIFPRFMIGAIISQKA